MSRLRQVLFPSYADGRRIGFFPGPRRRHDVAPRLTQLKPLSRPSGPLSAGEAEDGHVLALPELGRLSLGGTVYLVHEGPGTIGLLFARDRSARTCLLTLNLRPSHGDLAWHATVERVTREGVHSSDGLGAAFLFYPRQTRETAG